ncbi:MAG: leucine-rich repeat protein [Bacteroidales bacterium]|nr:leucine-rich repeat protein [Bacteroidales bacterium]
MRKVYTLLMLFSLLAAGKAIAATGDVIIGYVTHIDKDGNSHSVKMQFQISDQTKRHLRIYGYEKEKSIYNSLSPSDTYYEGEIGEGEIIVPEKLSDYTVTSVGAKAFYMSKVKVTLPESVTEIEEYAFERYYYDGYDFQLPSKVTILKEHAFENCYLKGISLNPGLKVIEDWAFNWSQNLEALIIPKSVEYIGYYQTRGCNALRRLQVEAGNPNYYTPDGSNVIMKKSSKEIIAGCPVSRIPKEAERIGEEAFSCLKFVNTTLTIPENITSIGEDAVVQSNIRHLILRSDSVNIEFGAFRFNRVLQILDIYGSKVTIAPIAFADITRCKQVRFHSHKPIFENIERQFQGAGTSNEDNVKTVLYAKYPEEFTEDYWKEWFDSGFHNVSELASSTIDEIHITDFDWPVAESDCDVTATSLTKGATVSEIQYKMFNKNYGTKASLNDSIDVCFFITLDEGYFFGDAPSLYVDDKKFDLRIKTSSMTDNTLGFIFHYRVPAPPGGVPIKSVSITVPEPVEGQPLSNEVTRPTGKLYLLQGWTYKVVAWVCQPGASLDSYDPAKIYGLEALVVSKEDYCFGADCTFTLNGKTAIAHRVFQGGQEGVVLALVYDNAKRGDVNRDGDVNSADVVAVYGFIEKGDNSGILRIDADVNDDDEINSADVVEIYNIIINGDTE